MARPMTVAEKILAAHAGLDEVKPGQLVECDLDIVLANDITAPIAIDVFRELGATEVFDRDRICLVPDHYAPNKDIKSAEQTKKMRDFAHEQHVTHYYEQGCAGIEHALLPERGFAYLHLWRAGCVLNRRGLDGRGRGHCDGSRVV